MQQPRTTSLVIWALVFSLSLSQKSFAETKAPSSSAATTGKGIDFTGGADFNNLPTYIKSDTLTLKSDERHFVYSGNVETKHGDMTMTSDSLDGFYNEKSEIQRIIANKKVIVVKGADIRATSDHAIYEKATDTLTLTESPELTQNGSVLSADVIKIYLQENRSEAQGSVRVKLVQTDKKDSDDDRESKDKKPKAKK